MNKVYYVPFFPLSKIDYLDLFSLYDEAEYTVEKKTFDTIHYTSIKELAKRVGLTPYAVKKVIENTDFVSVDKKSKVITLKNYFPKGEKAAFVRLTAAEVKLLREKKDNLFCKYLLYMKYYCGLSKDKRNNFTAKQFLTACGYSTKSNKYISLISDYNSCLVSNGFIRISPFTDELGHTRNNYTFI